MKADDFVTLPRWIVAIVLAALVGAGGGSGGALYWQKQAESTKPEWAVEMATNLALLKRDVGYLTEEVKALQTPGNPKTVMAEPTRIQFEQLQHQIDGRIGQVNERIGRLEKAVERALERYHP